MSLLQAATNLGQGYVFTRVCDSVHRGVCLSACWDTHPPGPDQTPQEQTPSRTRPPPGPDPLQDQTTPRSRPPGARSPFSRPTPRTSQCPTRSRPPSSACWEIRATTGRYASYWNAYLFQRRYAENIQASGPVTWNILT